MRILFVQLQMSLSDRLGQGRLTLRPTQTRVTTAGIFFWPLLVVHLAEKEHIVVGSKSYAASACHSACWKKEPIPVDRQACVRPSWHSYCWKRRHTGRWGRWLCHLKIAVSLKLVLTIWTCSNSKRCWVGSENVFVWGKRLVDRPQEGIYGLSAAYPKSESGSAGELGSCHLVDGLQLLHKAGHKWESHCTLLSYAVRRTGNSMWRATSWSRHSYPML